MLNRADEMKRCVCVEVFPIYEAVDMNQIYAEKPQKLSEMSTVESGGEIG